ncbi:MAG: HIT family protein [Hadesarchaea archaeon]|nr:HIT family protein [Hadesarchaea archaeon]
MTKDCIFCKIAQGKAEGRKIYEDEKTVALIDIKPRFAWGQCVIFPKKHVRQFYHLNKENYQALFKTVKKVAEKLESEFESEFVSIFSRGQTLEHAHVILFPAGSDEPIDNFIELILAHEELDEEATDEGLDKLQGKLEIK